MLGLDCTIYSRHAKHLNHFHLRCLCGLLYIRWQDKIPDLEFIERARIASIHTLPKKPTLDGSAMSPECLTAVCQSSYCTGHLVGGLKCSVGGQKKCFKDCLKEALKDLDINPSSWESLAQDCPASHSKVTTRANAAKYQQTTEPQRKRATRKDRATSTSTAAPTHSCPMCGWTF